MHDFDYHRPFAWPTRPRPRPAADGKLVAGGMTLVPTMKQRLAEPSDLVDLGGIAELKGIKVDGDGSSSAPSPPMPRWPIPPR